VGDVGDGGDENEGWVDSVVWVALSPLRMNFSSSLRQSFKCPRRGAGEALDVVGSSRSALYDIDRKWERRFDRAGGVFIGAGANDGVRPSNTGYFQKIRGWPGWLVEPVPEAGAEWFGGGMFNTMASARTRSLRGAAVECVPARGCRWLKRGERRSV
jgi:hypothetical protein